MIDICKEQCTSCERQGTLCRQFAYLNTDNKNLKEIVKNKLNIDYDIIQENLDLKSKVEWYDKKLHEKNIKNIQYVQRCNQCSFKEQTTIFDLTGVD